MLAHQLGLHSTRSQKYTGFPRFMLKPRQEPQWRAFCGQTAKDTEVGKERKAPFVSPYVHHPASLGIKTHTPLFSVFLSLVHNCGINDTSAHHTKKTPFYARRQGERKFPGGVQAGQGRPRFPVTGGSCTDGGAPRTPRV